MRRNKINPMKQWLARLYGLIAAELLTISELRSTDQERVTRLEHPTRKEPIMCEEERIRRNLAAVVRHLEQNGLRFGQAPDRPVVFMAIGAKHGFYPCVLNVTDRLFTCLVTFGSRVPEEKRQTMAELITRANYGLPLETLEMDFRDGELRVRTTVIIGDDEPADNILEATIRQGIGVAGHYHPAIMSLLWNDLSPEDAIALVERDSDG